MFKLDTRIDWDHERFFRWWGGELAFLVPAPLLKLLGKGRARLVLARQDGLLTLGAISHEGSRVFGQWPMDEAGPALRAKILAENPDLDDAEWVLRLGPAQCLVKVFKLPAVAEENLQQVVAFEMDRLTPFNSSQVYFDVKLRERLAETRQILVEMALVPRRVLDPILGELAESGWRPERVDVGVGEEGFLGHDLLPDQFRPPQNPWPKRLTIASAALLSVLLLGVLGLPLVMDQRLLAELQTQVKTASKAAQEVVELRETAEKLTNENDFLLRKKREEPVLVDMLEELTKVIPDQTSLNGLQYRDRKVIIQGQSPAASSLIERMEASPYFKNTSFVSPVTKDVSNGQERFQIASEVVNGRFSEKPTE